MSAKPILCPKCGSANICLIEHATTYLSHYPEDVDGYQEPGGVTKVCLSCKECSHEHTLRGKIQFDEELEERLLANLKLLSK